MGCRYNIQTDAFGARVHPYILIEIHRMNYHVHGAKCVPVRRLFSSWLHKHTHCAAHIARLTNEISYTERIQKGRQINFRFVYWISLPLIVSRSRIAMEIECSELGVQDSNLWIFTSILNEIHFIFTLEKSTSISFLGIGSISISISSKSVQN